MYKNICKKYNIEVKDFKEAIQKIYIESRSPEWDSDLNLMMAIADFICNADIEEKDYDN